MIVDSYPRIARLCGFLSTLTPAAAFAITTVLIRRAVYADGRHISFAGIFRWIRKPG
jgi:hypothetical protein